MGRAQRKILYISLGRDSCALFLDAAVQSLYSPHLIVIAPTLRRKTPAHSYPPRRGLQVLCFCPANETSFLFCTAGISFPADSSPLELTAFFPDYKFFHIHETLLVDTARYKV